MSYVHTTLDNNYSVYIFSKTYKIIMDAKLNTASGFYLLCFLRLKYCYASHKLHKPCLKGWDVLF